MDLISNVTILVIRCHSSHRDFESDPDSTLCDTDAEKSCLSPQNRLDAVWSGPSLSSCRHIIASLAETPIYSNAVKRRRSARISVQVPRLAVLQDKVIVTIQSSVFGIIFAASSLTRDTREHPPGYWNLLLLLPKASKCLSVVRVIYWTPVIYHQQYPLCEC